MNMLDFSRIFADAKRGYQRAQAKVPPNASQSTAECKPMYRGAKAAKDINFQL